jgi:hypothetical protein
MIVMTATYGGDVGDAFPVLIESIDERHFRRLVAQRMLALNPTDGDHLMASDDGNIATTSQRRSSPGLIADLAADWRRWSKAERVGAGIAAILMPLWVANW